MQKLINQLKRSVHSWGFELNLIRRIHLISTYWASGEITKEGLPDKPIKALVLAPHPDDESIGCGGTIRLINDSNGSVDVIYMTHGEQGRQAGGSFDKESETQFGERRAEEAKVACSQLGIKGITFLSGRDGLLRDSTTLARDIASQLDAQNYDIIFCPWPYDSHSDHEATYKHLRRAMQLCAQPVKSIWLYEVWSPLHANRIINVDATIDQKISALRSYRSQIEINDYPTKIRALAQYRSIHIPNSKHAEAFLALEGADLALLP